MSGERFPLSILRMLPCLFNVSLQDRGHSYVFGWPAAACELSSQLEPPSWSVIDEHNKQFSTLYVHPVSSCTQIYIPFIVQYGTLTVHFGILTALCSSFDSHRIVQSIPHAVQHRIVTVHFASFDVSSIILDSMRTKKSNYCTHEKRKHSPQYLYVFLHESLYFLPF